MVAGDDAAVRLAVPLEIPCPLLALPRLGADRQPRDPQDHERDDRVGRLRPEGDRDRRRDDREPHQPVRPRLVAVGHQRRALQAAAGAQADDRRDLVPQEAGGAGDPERQQVIDVFGIDEPVDGLERGDARAEERSRRPRGSPPPARRIWTSVTAA
jgi:hypothetical protein